MAAFLNKLIDLLVVYFVIHLKSNQLPLNSEKILCHIIPQHLSVFYIRSGRVSETARGFSALYRAQE